MGKVLEHKRRRSNSLVFHRQLAHDRLVLVRHGRNDHDAHFARGFQVHFVACWTALLTRADTNIICYFRRYNSEDPEEADETGWKLVHGDVFRPPARPMLFSVLVGSGIQMLGMVMVTLSTRVLSFLSNFCLTNTLTVFAVLGFLSPANRGGLMSAALVLYVWMGYGWDI